MTVQRICGTMVCLKGTLYVLGGTYSSVWKSPCLSVECYDPTENKWIKITTIPVEMTSKHNKDSFTGCVLKLSKGVLGKLNVIKENVLRSEHVIRRFGILRLVDIPDVPLVVPVWLAWPL